MINVSSTSTSYNTLEPYIFGLNWDWRLGGSILRQLDINLVGRYKYTPGLEKIKKAHVPGYDNMNTRNYFIGVELTTRLSIFNVNCRFGKEYFDGTISSYNTSTKTFSPVAPVNQGQTVFSVGITLNGKVYKSNNMLRLWDRPLFMFDSKK